MKRIKFTELGFKKNLDTLIVVIGIICLVVGFVGIFIYPESKYGSLAGLSAGIINYPLLKTLFYKNYFYWNKKGGSLKINSKSKSISFSEIDNFQFEEEKLILTKKNKNKFDFKLSDINVEDVDNLKIILAKYINN